jgi:hypothetical protein
VCPEALAAGRYIGHRQKVQVGPVAATSAARLCGCGRAAGAAAAGAAGAAGNGGLRLVVKHSGKRRRAARHSCADARPSQAFAQSSRCAPPVWGHGTALLLLLLLLLLHTTAAVEAAPAAVTGAHRGCSRNYHCCCCCCCTPRLLPQLLPLLLLLLLLLLLQPCCPAACCPGSCCNARVWLALCLAAGLLGSGDPWQRLTRKPACQHTAQAERDSC